MPWYKNTASQKVAVAAYDTTDGSPKTGDAANITAYIAKDFGTPAQVTDTNPVELDATNHPGIYVFDLTQAETNAEILVITPKSSTANIALDTVVIQPFDPDLQNVATTTEIKAAVHAGTLLEGTVDTGSDTDTVVFLAGGISPQLTVADQLKGRVILFKNDTTTDQLRGQGAPIAASTTTSISVAAGDAFTTSPVSGDTFVVV